MRTDCSKCGGVLDGAHKSYCKACFAEYSKQLRDRDRDTYNAYQRAYNDANPEKRQQYKRKNHLKASYGLVESTVTTMRETQKNQCAICHSEMTDERGAHRLHIDHDHQSGQVRELLCSNCNMMIGLANDDLWVLSQAITYIRRHRIRKVS